MSVTVQKLIEGELIHELTFPTATTWGAIGDNGNLHVYETNGNGKHSIVASFNSYDWSNVFFSDRVQDNSKEK